MDVVTDSCLYQQKVIDGFDAEALLSVVKDARFEQRLLRGGKFRAHVQRISFPGYSLDCGDYSLPVFGRGSFGEGVVALALAMRCTKSMWANGTQVECCSRLAFFAERQELDVRPGPGQWRWCVLLLPRDTLIAEVRHRHGHEPRLPSQGWWALEPLQSHHRELIGVILRTLRVASAWTIHTHFREVTDAGRGLLGAFVDAMVQSLPGRVRRHDGVPMHARHSLLIRRAEDFLEEREGQEFTVAALSAAIGIGERQMERIFRAAYGMGPCRWHHVARLNRAHRMLRTATGNLHVTDVASGLGFGHLGRFSHDYHELFGEFPRDTLSRGRHGQLRIRQ